MEFLSRVFALQAAIVIMLHSFTLADEPGQAFSIITKRETDKVIVSSDTKSTIFSIHSPLGIGQATIERTAALWPNMVTLRLHLKGLESFRVTHGDTTLEASVSSHHDNMRLRPWVNKKENELLNSGSKHWMEIRMVGNDGKTTNRIPLNNGYFEMHLPMAIFEENPKSLTFHWIDFYR